MAIGAVATIDFKLLETAFWVARLESFSAAAERLNTTQPAISIRIAELEAALDTRLFTRARREVAATDAGRIVCDYAERLLRLRAEMIHAVAGQGAWRGALRLGVAETVVHTWLPRFLEAMNRHHPDLAIELDVDVSVALGTRLAQHRLDLAFLVGGLGHAAIIERPLCRYPVHFIASPRLGLPARRLALSEITARPILTFARNTQPYVTVTRLLADPARPAPRIFASASVATLVRMALDGLGIAAIPPAIVRDEIASGQLAVLKTRERFPDLDFVAAWADTPARLRIEAIVDRAITEARAF